MFAIQTYIQRQVLVPLITVTAALAGVALLSQSLSTLDLVIDQGQTFVTFLYITLLALPHLVSLILPLALFIASVYALNRLMTDSELVAVRAAGMSRRTIADPIIRLAVVCVIVHLFLSLFAQPTAYRIMREEFFEIRNDLAAKMVEAGEFVEPEPGLTIYVREVRGSGELIDLFIEDARKADRPQTIVAERGQFTRSDEAPAIITERASVHWVEEDGSLGVLEYDRYPFDLSQFLAPDSELFYKVGDRYLDELLFPDLLQVWDRTNYERLIAEGHGRLSSPLYNIVFALIALAAMLGGDHSRNGYGRRILVASGVVLVLQVVGYAAQSASAEEMRLNPLQYLIPLGGGFLAVFYLNLQYLRTWRDRRAAKRAVDGFARGSAS